MTALTINPQGLLLCPLCGEDHVHLDDVYVAGRPREDGQIVPVHVDQAGTVREGSHLHIPSTGGRRHAFSLGGWCEGCSVHFAFEFKQHKGQTEVRTLVSDWTEAALWQDDRSSDRPSS